MGKPKGVAQQIAEFEVPAVTDFDPEEDAPAENSDDSAFDSSEDDLAGTEHYAKVGKSKLRNPAEVLLGPEYSGARVTRDALDEESGEEDDENAHSEFTSSEEGEQEEQSGQYADPENVAIDMDEEDGDIDSDGALGESDLERFKDFTFRGSSKPRSLNGGRSRPVAADFMSDSDDEGVALNGSLPEEEEEESDEDMMSIPDQSEEQVESDEASNIEKSRTSEASSDENESQSGEEDEESENETEDSDDDADEKKSRRAELRKIMSEEQKTVVATISQAAKADAEKGNAVKEQRKAFDSLLGVRMVLQKALVATNTMAVTEERDSEEAANQPYEAAEEAAIKLWNTLDSIRHDLQKTSTGSKSGQKRKREIDSAAPSSAIWERMQGLEVAAIDNRQRTLEKWSSKVKGTAAMPVSRKLNPTANQQSITSVLQDQLASSDHLIQRTKIPRSCAPVQRDSKVTEDPNIYDDGNFYQMLLKELVDQRRVESLANPVNSAGKTMQWTAVKEAKTRKVVDTKASKGRKMRFTVHEKLQNFMAPEDRRNWESHAIDGFFGSLLGQKMTLGEEDSEEETEGNNGVPLEEEGLMLFRS
ncbi:TRAUB-domain-containing protein [Mollisia scopiformis]|uniref:Protein BFR2 n=1 Tax=Mollisia scopiformis TaxID=149040 RepID=A0A194XS84_MOLSC|nr:TRAUB-domain-containing protein [Mollisia scopiformis]KUJ23160.1 TRAUB-domain-containing protein [Mollisia scopiformis]